MNSEGRTGLRCEMVEKSKGARMRVVFYIVQRGGADFNTTDASLLGEDKLLTVYNDIVV